VFAQKMRICHAPYAVPSPPPPNVRYTE
jgi:hypothetical protein